MLPIPQLVSELISSACADAILGSLICALLPLLPNGGGGGGGVPSELREAVLRAWIKFYCVLGVCEATAALWRVMSTCESNEVKASASGERPSLLRIRALASLEQQQTFATQLEKYALSGDWKKFKAIVRILCRG